MNEAKAIEVHKADVIGGAVVVTFGNEKTVVYPASLLFAVMDQAQVVLDPGPSEPEN